MCTSIAMNTKGGFFFGRNLDLECGFGEQVTITPQGYAVRLCRAGEMRIRYAMIGMAAVEEGYPLYAEAANESGLCIAGLNFPGNAYYPPEAGKGKTGIAPFELPLWLLGQCKTLVQARELLEHTQLVGVPFSDRLPLSPLHWHVADESGSIVVESTRAGMRIYDNPAGVLTNNPPFDFHMANLSQYLSVTNAHPESRFSRRLALEPFGRGFGAIGLPGDYSPASRFIKAAFLLNNSPCGLEAEESIAHYFHLLSAVMMPKGSVLLPDGQEEITRYSCCIDTRRGVYYYRTYDATGLTVIRLCDAQKSGETITAYPLERARQMVCAN